MSGKPISPSDLHKREPEIPGYVFDAINELISQNFTKKGMTISVDLIDITNKLKEEGHKYENWMLDIEDEYRKAGWDVNYNGLFMEDQTFYFKEL